MSDPIDYNQVAPSAAIFAASDRIAVLEPILADLWCADYQNMTAGPVNILRFEIEGFVFLFDFATELTHRGVVPPDKATDDRVVAVLGCSRIVGVKRDTSRMHGFLGPSNQVLGEGYDKGHYIGHSLGGGLDVNLFPQRRDINRGWSAAGKRFRAMERYCAENPGTFCFSRPLYGDQSWRPHGLEYGVLMPEGQWWVEQFEN